MQKYTLQFSDQSYADLEGLSDLLDMTKAEVVREALSMYRWIVQEKMAGHRLLIDRESQVNELLIPRFDRLPAGAGARNAR
jgi:hypothetical protein